MSGNASRTRGLTGWLRAQPPLRPFRSGDFRLLWTGFAVSLLGDGMLFVALPWLVLTLHDSTGALAAVGVGMAVSSVPAALLVGSLINRLGARRVMLASDLLRGLVLLSIGVLSVVGSLTLWQVVVAMMVFAVGDALFVPALSTMVQSVVSREDLVGANAADQIIRPIAWRLVGPVLGGLLVAGVGVGWVLLIDAATFGLSACCLLGVRAERDRAAEPETGLVADAIEGWRYAWRNRWLFWAFVAGGVSVICVMGPWNVLVPYFVRNELHHGAGTYGLIVAVGGIGQLAAGILISRTEISPRTVIVLYVAWGMIAGGLLGFSLAVSLVAAIIGSLVINAALAVSTVIWGALLQTVVSRQYVARVFGIDWALAQILTPVSYVAAGALGAATSTRFALGVAAVVGLVVVPSFLLVRAARQLPIGEQLNSVGAP